MKKRVDTMGMFTCSVLFKDFMNALIYENDVCSLAMLQS